MKKFIIFAVLLSFLFAGSVHAADTVTTYYNLICPEEGTLGWTRKISNDLISMDSIMQSMSEDSATHNTEIAVLQPGQTVTVAETNGDYQSIQDAIDSITDATRMKKYVVLVYPGIYNENVVGKDFVSIMGMGVQGSAVISKDSGIVYDFPDKGGNISNMKLSGVPTASGMTLMSIDSGRHLVRNLTLFMESSTNNITGSHISLAGGTLDLNGCESFYEMNGTNAGALVHNIINMPGGSPSLELQNSICDVDIADADDIAVFVNEESSVGGGERIIQDNNIHMNMTHASFSGAAGFYYSHGAQTTKSVLGNHVHLSTPGDGIGYVFYMDTMANDGIIRSTSNQYYVVGFANSYFSNLGVGDKIVTHFDDISADTGNTGSGSLVKVSSFVDGCFKVTGAVSADNISTDVIRFDSVVASPDVSTGAPLMCISEDPGGTMRIKFFDGTNWKLVTTD